MCDSRSISNWLLQKQIKVPLEWLDACLVWLNEEYHEQTMQRQEVMRNQVYEQWLMTDLNELGISTLPEDVKAEKFTLKGIYCLQINSIINTGQSYYSQLLEVRGKNNSNTNVSAETQSTQATQKSDTSRLLLMELTDGVLNVLGMEYQFISCLHSTIRPGSKIRVRGPILCRKGMLMFSKGCLELLGGEADSFRQNTPEAVLCKALNLPTPQLSPENTQCLDDLPEEVLNDLLDDEQEVVSSNQVNREELPIEDEDIEELLACDFLQEEMFAESLSKPKLSYLCEIKQRQQQVGDFYIKAVVITLLSKLSNSSHGWSLSARLSDGTDLVDVIFCDHLLKEIIGFSSTQVNQIKSNPHSIETERLKKGMAKCKEKIVEKCQIFQISYKTMEKTKVIAIVPPQTKLFPHFF